MREYRVRKISRYTVTCYEEHDSGIGSIQTIGEFDNEDSANRVINAFGASDPDAKLTFLDTPLQPTYFVAHPDGTYTAANPQPMQN